MRKKKLQQQIDDIWSRLSCDQAMYEDWVRTLNIALSELEAHVLLNTPKCDHTNERGTPYSLINGSFNFCPKCGEKL
jgi:hypothetical protein